MNVSIIVLTGLFAAVSGTGLNEEFIWSRINFAWPQETELGDRSSINSHQKLSDGANNDAIVFDGMTNSETNSTSSGNGDNQGNQDSNVNNGGLELERDPGSIDYQYVNNIPMGANVWQDKLFITIPRRRLGVPSTLNYVPFNSKKRVNVALRPYPNWNINLYPDTSGKLENFVSVYRVAIDLCDRMWFVDTGIIETIGNRTTVKPHQLIIINLQNDQIIHRYNLPDSVITPATVLASVTIDASKDSCDNAYAYFPDLAGYGLIVYSLKENQAWRVKHNYFFLESLAGEFFIAGHHFQWNDGVFSVELSDIKPDGFRDMYFHAMAGTHIYRVSTRVLRNKTAATRSYHGDDFQVVGDRGPQSQTATADIHKPSGVMFLGLVNQNALGCWNINDDLKTLSIVHKDNEKMIYPSDVKISRDRIYVLTNTMPGFLYGKLDYDKPNFRVWSNDVGKAIQGTRCQTKATGGYN